MFSRFLRKGNAGAAKQVDAGDSRGLEVVEDDPETSWSMWDNALAAQDSRHSSLSSLPPLPSARDGLNQDFRPTEAFPDFDEVDTEPMGLEDRTPAQRAAAALEIVGLYHHRIANTIRTMWGYKECSVYINRLIMNGGDGMGQNRIGFNADAAQAMLLLADLHDQIFGPADPGSTLSFSDSYHASLDGHR